MKNNSTFWMSAAASLGLALSACGGAQTAQGQAPEASENGCNAGGSCSSESGCNGESSCNAESACNAESSCNSEADCSGESACASEGGCS